MKEYTICPPNVVIEYPDPKPRIHHNYQFKQYTLLDKVTGFEASDRIELYAEDIIKLLTSPVNISDEADRVVTFHALDLQRIAIFLDEVDSLCLKAKQLEQQAGLSKSDLTARLATANETITKLKLDHSTLCGHIEADERRILSLQQELERERAHRLGAEKVVDELKRTVEEAKTKSEAIKCQQLPPSEVKILEVMTNAGKGLGLREISVMVGQDISNTRKRLKRLVDMGLVKKIWGEGGYLYLWGGGTQMLDTVPTTPLAAL